VVGAIGIAALVVGGVTRGLALGQKKTIDGHCDAEKFCDQTGMDAVSSVRTLQTVSTVSLIAGAVGLSTGAYLVLSHPKRPEPQATLGAVVLAGGAGLSFRRSF